MTQTALDKLRSCILSDDQKIAIGSILFICLMAGGLVGLFFGGLGPVLALAVIGVAGIAYLVTRSIQWSILALIAQIILLPYAALPFKIIFTPTFLNVLLGMLFGVWVLRIITGKETTFIATPVGIPIFAFLAWTTVTFIAGLAHSPLTHNVLRNFAEVILAVSLFFVMVNQIKDATKLERISLIFLVAGFIAALLGIMFYMMPETLTIPILSKLGMFGYPTNNILHYIEDNPENPMRAISTSIDPNAFGGLLVILMIIAVAYLFASKPIMPRFYLVVITGTIALALYLTFSRGSMVGVVVALTAMSLLRYRKLLLYMAIIALLFLILPQTQMYVTRFIEGLQGNDLATQMRFGEYKDAMILISRYPLMGVGFTGTPDIDIYVGVSNLYLLIAGHTGVVGLGLFLIVNIVFFITVFQRWQHMPHGHYLETPLLGYTLAIFGAMVGGIFDHFFFNIQFTHLVSLYWIVMENRHLACPTLFL